MKRYIESIAIWTVSGALTILLWIVMLFCTVILYPFDRQRRTAHAQCYWWSDALTTLNPSWEVTVKGLENIDKKRTYVIVANHQSLADIVILYKTKTQFKWVAKESLFRVPFVGWSMRLARHIALARGDLSSIKHVYHTASAWLREGMSVLFFPEGTRSESPVPGDFQNGAFKLAIREGVPVLPIAIKGTGGMIPKGDWLFTTKVPGTLTVLPAIETRNLSTADFARLRDMARDAIIRSL